MLRDGIITLYPFLTERAAILRAHPTLDTVTRYDLHQPKKRKDRKGVQACGCDINTDGAHQHGCRSGGRKARKKPGPIAFECQRYGTSEWRPERARKPRKGERMSK